MGGHLFRMRLEWGVLMLSSCFWCIKILRSAHQTRMGGHPFSMRSKMRMLTLSGVRLLLARRDTDISLPDNFGQTPFHCAVERGGIEVAQLLLMRQDIGINLPEKKWTGTPLLSAVHEREVVRLLLTRQDIDVNSQDRNRHTPLSYAVKERRYDSSDIIRLLLA